MNNKTSPIYLFGIVMRTHSLYALHFSQMNFIRHLLTQVYIESYYLRLYTL